EATRRQARAGDRRLAGHRRNGRGDAGGRGRARDPGCALHGQAGGGRGAHPLGRRQRYHRTNGPDRGRVDRQARYRGQRALGQARPAGAECRDAGQPHPCRAYRSQGIWAHLVDQPARQPGADRRLRPAAARVRQGRGGRGHQLGRPRGAGFLGRVRLEQGCTGRAARRLCGRNRLHRQAAGHDPGSRRDADSDARAGVPRGGAGAGEAPGGGRCAAARGAAGCRRNRPAGAGGL
ncbi:MAG: hypothetical protein AVDCRST_MAG09-1964, partial [uncultured Sphingomonas sp.]